MKSFQVARWFAIAAVSILIGVLSFAPTARAIPYLYTFEGTTTADENYNPDLPHHLPGGQFVSYTFLIDFDRAGSHTSGGVTTPMVDTAEYDYFYTEFVSGTNISPRPDGTGYSNNNGGNCLPSSTCAGAGFISGSPNGFFPNGIFIDRFAPVSSWQVGDSMIGEDYVGVAFLEGTTTFDPDFSLTYSSLTLVSIASVPEPSTMLLLGTGLLGIVGLNRRRKA